MQPTTWAIVVFILIESLLFGSAGYCFWTGHWAIALAVLIFAVMCRIRAVNDGPNGDGSMVILSLLRRKYMPRRKRPNK